MKTYTIFWRTREKTCHGWHYYDANSAKEARTQHLELYPLDVITKVRLGKVVIHITI